MHILMIGVGLTVAGIVMQFVGPKGFIGILLMIAVSMQVACGKQQADIEMQQGINNYLANNR